ncbi:hypothetical protein [Halorarius litoreus]|uniref:hypothetical protein n=1 Tax=Halorarius litoreus TaxID=2962676 RepID=UPI0020CC50C3|nr:hypothetical protein [Halorarius litoreus]
MTRTSILPDEPVAEWPGAVDWPRLLYTGAYAATLAGTLVSGWLTYIYVGAGARELNPVIVALIALVGFEWMVLVKVAVVVVCFHAYSLLATATSTGLVLGFSWLAAWIHLFDAAHDIGVALLAGWIPADRIALATLLILVGLVVGLLFRPPEVVPNGLRVSR